MPKRRYSKRDSSPGLVFEGRFFDESKKVEIYISTVPDGNMDLRYSMDAKDNYDRFFEKHGLNSNSSFSPAIGQNYRIITIDESNEKKFAGLFIENSDPREEYHCDAVIVCGASIPVAFRVGDCPPVLIVGEVPKKNMIITANIHTGRAELMADIPKITVSQMKSNHQMYPHMATAYIFPHICPHCYALQRVDVATEEKARDFLKFTGGYHHLDLMSWLTCQLKEAGIRRIITAHNRCTAGISIDCISRPLYRKQEFQGFYSHYLSVHQDQPDGRFLIVTRIVDESEEKEEDFF